MTLFLIAVLSAVGMSHIIVDGSILAKFRGYIVTKYKKPWMVELISCYQCSGMWTGCFMGLILQPISWDWLNYWFSIPFYLVITPFIVGCASSYCSMSAAALLNYLDAPSQAMARNNENK